MPSPSPLRFPSSSRYFAFDSAKKVNVHGLEGVTYDDSVSGTSGAVQSGGVGCAGEIDRIYYNTPSMLVLEDGSRAVQLLKMGLHDAVVWNIGEKRASSLSDLGKGEWDKYVCLEAAQIGKPVKLAPSASWAGGQTFKAMTAAAAVEAAAAAAAKRTEAAHKKTASE